MIVSCLIALLETMPQEAEVVVDDGSLNGINWSHIIEDVGYDGVLDVVKLF